MMRIARGPAQWRLVAMFVVAGAGLLALGVWVFRTPALDFDDEAQVREWTAYALAGQSDPLQVQSLERAGNQYTGEATGSNGRVFRLRVEEREGRLDITADWQSRDGREGRRAWAGPPPVEVRHPWVRWSWVPVVALLVVGLLVRGLRSRRAAKPLQLASRAPSANARPRRVTRKRRPRT